MASPAVFCLSLQLRPTNESESGDQAQSDLNTNIGSGSQQANLITATSGDKTANTTAYIDSNGTLMRTITNPLNDPILSSGNVATHGGGELNGNSIILLRGSRANNSQILLQACEDTLQIQNGSMISLQTCDNDDRSYGQLFQIQNDNGDLGGGQIFLQSVKRLDNSAPILLYTSAVNDNHQSVDNVQSHILLTATGDDSTAVVVEDDAVQEEVMKTDAIPPDSSLRAGVPGSSGRQAAASHTIFAPLGSGLRIRRRRNVHKLGSESLRPIYSRIIQ